MADTSNTIFLVRQVLSKAIRGYEYVTLEERTAVEEAIEALKCVNTSFKTVSEQLPYAIYSKVWVVDTYNGEIHPFEVDSYNINRHRAIVRIKYCGTAEHNKYWEINVDLAKAANMLFTTEEAARQRLEGTHE